jgi:hypothetical protein
MTAQEWPRDLPDLRMYERMIDDGIAAAKAHGGVIDHLTAESVNLNEAPSCECY